MKQLWPQLLISGNLDCYSGESYHSWNRHQMKVVESVVELILMNWFWSGGKSLQPVADCPAIATRSSLCRTENCKDTINFLSMAVPWPCEITLRVGARDRKFCSWAESETQAVIIRCFYEGFDTHSQSQFQYQTKRWQKHTQAARHYKVSSPFIQLKATLCVPQVHKKGSTEVGAWPLALGWKRVDVAQLAQSPGCLGSYVFSGLMRVKCQRTLVKYGEVPFWHWDLQSYYLRTTISTFPTSLWNWCDSISMHRSKRIPLQFLLSA